MNYNAIDSNVIVTGDSTVSQFLHTNGNSKGVSNCAVINDELVQNADGFEFSSNEVNNNDYVNFSSDNACQIESDDSNIVEKINVNCLTLNVCGVRSKLLSDDLLQLIDKYDIISLSETKLDDLDTVDIPGYTVFYKNRQKYKRKSGGIMLCIRNYLLEYLTVFESNSKKDKIDTGRQSYYTFLEYELSSEVLYFKLNKELLDRDVTFGCVYFPPAGSDFFLTEMLLILWRMT